MLLFAQYVRCFAGFCQDVVIFSSLGSPDRMELCYRADFFLDSISSIFLLIRPVYDVIVRRRITFFYYT